MRKNQHPLRGYGWGEQSTIDESAYITEASPAVIFPQVSIDSPDLAVFTEKSAAGPSSSILVVDDDALHRALVVRIVVGAGFKAHPAEDGEQAWDALSRSKFDLLITDHEMPKLKGLELIERLRKVSEAPPCILMSGSQPQPEWMIEEIVRPGAFLPKPFAMGELVRMIAGLLGRTRSPAC